jgi:hypothetical protein
MDTTKAKYGYNQSKIINGFWKYKTRPICFALVVDDFAVKYINEEDAEHLINAIKKYYTMTVDKEATKYIGLTIEWDYTTEKCTFTCRDIFKKHAQDSTTRLQIKYRTHHTPM